MISLSGISKKKHTEMTKSLLKLVVLILQQKYHKKYLINKSVYKKMAKNNLRSSDLIYKVKQET